MTPNIENAKYPAALPAKTNKMDMPAVRSLRVLLNSPINHSTINVINTARHISPKITEKGYRFGYLEYSWKVLMASQERKDNNPIMPNAPIPTEHRYKRIVCPVPLFAIQISVRPCPAGSRHLHRTLWKPTSGGSCKLFRSCPLSV